MKMIPDSAARRAMKVVEVILKAIGGEIKWIQAADILGVTPRHYPANPSRLPGAGDRRACTTGGGGGRRPDERRMNWWKRSCVCTHDKYFDFNVKHFHEQLVAKHGLSCSYTWTKNLLQEAGYVKRSKGRGGHRHAERGGPCSARCCTWTGATTSGWHPTGGAPDVVAGSG